MTDCLPPWQWTATRSYHIERHWDGSVRAYYVKWDAPDGVGERHSSYLKTIGLDGVDHGL